MSESPSEPPATTAEIRQALQPPRRRWKWAIAAVGLCAVAVAAWAAVRRDGPETRYLTSASERGRLAVTVTAMGRLKARETVDVGAEVSGRILAVHVDFNDKVRAGDVLA